MQNQVFKYYFHIHLWKTRKRNSPKVNINEKTNFKQVSGCPAHSCPTLYVCLGASANSDEIFKWVLARGMEPSGQVHRGWNQTKDQYEWELNQRSPYKFGTPQIVTSLSVERGKGITGDSGETCLHFTIWIWMDGGGEEKSKF